MQGGLLQPENPWVHHGKSSFSPIKWPFYDILKYLFCVELAHSLLKWPLGGFLFDHLLKSIGLS